MLVWLFYTMTLYAMDTYCSILEYNITCFFSWNSSFDSNKVDLSFHDLGSDIQLILLIYQWLWFYIKALSLGPWVTDMESLGLYVKSFLTNFNLAWFKIVKRFITCSRLGSMCISCSYHYECGYSSSSRGIIKNHCTCLPHINFPFRYDSESVIRNWLTFCDQYTLKTILERDFSVISLLILFVCHVVDVCYTQESRPLLSFLSCYLVHGQIKFISVYPDCSYQAHWDEYTLMSIYHCFLSPAARFHWYSKARKNQVIQ